MEHARINERPRYHHRGPIFRQRASRPTQQTASGINNRLTTRIRTEHILVAGADKRREIPDRAQVGLCHRLSPSTLALSILSRQGPSPNRKLVARLVRLACRPRHHRARRLAAPQCCAAGVMPKRS